VGEQQGGQGSAGGGALTLGGGVVEAERGGDNGRRDLQLAIFVVAARAVRIGSPRARRCRCMFV
jgi:hypothetical protein